MIGVFLIMGVSGSGKTSVGQALASRLGVRFYDGDDFHPPENVTKMANGVPLTDADRRPWLAALHDLIADHLARHEAAVIACSALKAKYREQLRAGNDGLQIIYLQGSQSLIWERMQARAGHYMKADMLQSQFDTLEPPSPDEAWILNIEHAVDELVDEIQRRIIRSR